MFVFQGERLEKRSNMEGTHGLLAIFTIATCFLVNGAQKTGKHVCLLTSESFQNADHSPEWHKQRSIEEIPHKYKIMTNSLGL